VGWHPEVVSCSGLRQHNSELTGAFPASKKITTLCESIFGSLLISVGCLPLWKPMGTSKKISHCNTNSKMSIVTFHFRSCKDAIICIQQILSECRFLFQKTIPASSKCILCSLLIRLDVLPQWLLSMQAVKF
jgi:hypothetical protein